MESKNFETFYSYVRSLQSLQFLKTAIMMQWDEIPTIKFKKDGGKTIYHALRFYVKKIEKETIDSNVEKNIILIPRFLAYSLEDSTWKLKPYEKFDDLLKVLNDKDYKLLKENTFLKPPLTTEENLKDPSTNTT